MPGESSWTVRVHGTPTPKGSLKCVGQRGRHQLIEDDKGGGRREWRQRVAAAARAVLATSGPLDGPVGISIHFRSPRPTSRKVGEWVTSRRHGDVDKLTRNLLDAITDAGLWGDDSQVVHLRDITHRYESTGNPPGATITIWQINGRN